MTMHDTPFHLQYLCLQLGSIVYLQRDGIGNELTVNMHDRVECDSCVLFLLCPSYGRLVASANNFGHIHKRFKVDSSMPSVTSSTWYPLYG